MSKRFSTAAGATVSAAFVAKISHDHDRACHKRLGTLTRTVNRETSHPIAAAAPTPAEVSRLAAKINAGRFGELETDARQLVRRYPQSGLVWQILGLSLWRQGKDSLPALERAAQHLPADAEAHSNLGNALRTAGRAEDAAAAHRRALAIRPDYAEAHNNLGSALQDLGRLHEAAASYGRAIELKPALTMAHINLGGVLRELGQPGAAEARFRGALALQPMAAEIHHNLAVVLKLQGRIAEAEASCRAALGQNPRLVPALVFLAKLQAERGDFIEAQALFERAMSIDPESPQAWSGIPTLRKMTPSDAGWIAGALRLADRCTAARQEVHLRYAIGKYFDDVTDFPQAFAHYRRANELTKSYAAKHDRGQLAQFADRIIRRHDGAWIRRSGDSAPAGRPVFIVGMPRSGTSLAEQILASHPAVFGAGELPFWGVALARSLAGTGADVDTDVGRLAHDYHGLLEGLSADAIRVIDKMPTNFLALGLIHAALPDARVIHMRRNPIDTCLSIYFQDFETAYSYANDLQDLAHCYGEYRRVMSHWGSVLPQNTILDVPYEGLVEHQELWSRRMLEFIDLPWDPACLNFHQTRRTVSTASSWQVRQPLNDFSVGRWRHYEPFVGPLLDLANIGP
jgi:tetratricopeptide (TPR) repeat protein